MGLLDIFFQNQQTQITSSILPYAAECEIKNDRLPQLNTTKIFLKKGEYCSYIDKAILNVKIKKRVSRHRGGSAPGLLKGHRVNYGSSRSEEYTEVKQQKGILYITNKRVIFQAPEYAFDKLHRYLSSIEPYSNAVVLQYGQKTYELIVPNGSIVNHVLTLINQ